MTKMTNPVVYVDSIEEGVARLVPSEGELRTVSVPAAWLPAGVREGQWVELQVRAAAPPPGHEESKALRERLGGGDDVGDLAL